MSESSATGVNREDAQSVLFAQLVLQQMNMAMLYLGKVAHPESGKTVKDLDAAKMFIDQLEMLEAKTRGNLDKDEASLLKQSLMNLRLAFVESVESPAPQTENKPADAAASAKPAEDPDSAASDEEHRKKFTKKY